MERGMVASGGGLGVETGKPEAEWDDFVDGGRLDRPLSPFALVQSMGPNPIRRCGS